MVLFQLSSSQGCPLSVCLFPEDYEDFTAELKLYLLISELLTSYNVQIPHSFTFLTLFYNAGVGFAPVCVTSCRSI